MFLHKHINIQLVGFDLLFRKYLKLLLFKKY